MRIGVIGAGAVGGALAAMLERSGHDVEVTARGAHLEAIRTHGLHLTGAWGEHSARVGAHETLTRPADLVILTTKAQDAAAALAENRSVANGTPLLVVQNGLAGVSGAAAACPGSPVVGALALFAASYVSPGRVTVTAAARTYLGGETALGHAVHTGAAGVAGATRAPGPATRLALDALTGVIPVEVLEGPGSFAGAQWTKLIVNQINALPAITGLSAQAVIANRRLRRIMTSSMREAARVGLATGVHFGSLQGLDHAKLSALAKLPLWIGQALPRELARRMGNTPNPGSTLQSIRRGQLTEIDYLNGAVVAAANAASLLAPINASLIGLVHEVEKRGAFLGVDEVVARVGALT